MKVSSTAYVTIEIQQSLLGMARIIGIPSGQVRTRADGEIEAEFLCISPGSNCEKIWATKSQIVIPANT